MLHVSPLQAPTSGVHRLRALCRELSHVSINASAYDYLMRSITIVKTVFEPTCLRDRQELCQHVVETGNMLPYSIMDKNVTFICSLR